MKPAQAGYLRALQDNPTTGSLQLVRVNLGALQETTTSIPLLELGTMRADRRKIEVRSPSDFTWFGNIQVTGGQAIFVVKNGDVTGSIRSGLDLYRVSPLGDGVHALIKVEQSKFPPDHSSPPPRAPNSGNVTPQTSPSAPSDVAADGVQVDVLVAYTASAATASGNIAALIQLAIDESNQAYTNSNANVAYRLVGTMEITGYSEAGKTFNDVLCDVTNQTVTGFCTAPNNAQMATVRARRDEVGADLVQVVFNNSSSCGLAWINSSADFAFSVSAWDCITGNYTFSHEIGHNFGARHNPESDSSTTPFAYGHGYRNCNVFRTIMAVQDSACPRIQHFSNPSVTFNGAVTGTAATHDVARVHRDRVATVAAFRAAVSQPSLTVTPATNITASGSTGGPFSPSSFQYQLSASTGSVAYSITGMPSWLTPSSTSGTVGAAASTVTFTVNANANALAAGTYGPTTITFTNTTNNQGTQTRTATLTVSQQTYTLTVSASPSAGGIVSGGGSFAAGSSRTVTATAASGYNFVNWTENGSQVSTSASYTFTLTGNRTLIANFTPIPTYIITVDASPSNGGTVSGGGTFPSGSSRTVTASPNPGYNFVNWTENGTQVSTSASYTFTLSGNRALLANFTPSPTNNNFANALTINSGQTTGGTNVGTTKETGEPNHAGNPGGKSVWWNFTAPNTGPVTVTTRGSTFDTLLAVYTGNTVNALSFIASDDDAGGNNTSLLTFNAVAGTAYRIAVDGFNGASGTIQLAISPRFKEFNADAKGDILWRHDSGTVGMWLMDGTRRLLTNVISTEPPEWKIIGTGDFNGDGKSDILWRHDNGTVGIWLMDGLTALSKTVVSVQPTQWKIVGTGDFNGDGKSDLLWRHDGGTVGIWLMDGTRPLATTVVSVQPPEWRIIGTGDFNGDGMSDILWRHDGGTVGIWLMDGTRPLATTVVSVQPTQWKIVATGDFDGDGKTDLLWRHDGGTVGIWLMDGTRPLATTVISVEPNDWKIVGTADFNGDRRSDILWRQNNGTVGIWLMNGTQALAKTVVSVEPNEWKTTGEFN